MFPLQPLIFSYEVEVTQQSIILVNPAISLNWLIPNREDGASKPIDVLDTLPTDKSGGFWA